MDQVIQAFMFACGKSPVGRQSIRASVKVSSLNPYPPTPLSPLASPLHTYTSHTERTGGPGATQRRDVTSRLTVSISSYSRTHTCTYLLHLPSLTLDHKSNSEEAISDEPDRSANDKKSKSNPNLALRSSQIIGRAPVLSAGSSPSQLNLGWSHATSPGSQLNLASQSSGDHDSPNWERAEVSENSTKARGGKKRRFKIEKTNLW